MKYTLSILASLLCFTLTANRAAAKQAHVSYHSSNYTDGLSSSATLKLETDLQSIANKLMNSDDPEIVINLEDAKMNEEVKITFNKDTPIIHLPTGVFAFTKNLNELAGVLAYHISRVRAQYQMHMSLKYAQRYVPPGQDPVEHFESLIKALKSDPDSEKHADEIKDAEMHLANCKQLARFSTREKEIGETLAKAGVKVDLTDSTKKSIRASQDALDRMVVGGFDPWGLLSPLQRITRANESMGYGPMAVAKRIFSPKPETINSELEFIKNYTLYLEQKKVDIIQQPYRGQPLTKEQARLHLAALLTQHAFLGPAMRQWGGMLLVGAGASAAIAKGGDLLSGWKSSAVEAQVEPTSIAELKKKADSPSTLDAMWDYISETTGKLLDVPYVRTGVNLLKETLPAPMKLAAYSGLLTIARNIDYMIDSKFWYQYRKNLEGQTKLSYDLTKWRYSKEKDVATLAELARTQAQVSDFVSDSLDPKLDKVKARLAYQYIFQNTPTLIVRFNRIFGPRSPDMDYKAQLEYRAEESLRLAFEKKNGRSPKNDEISQSEIKNHAQKTAFQEMFIEGKLPQTRGSAAQSLRDPTFKAWLQQQAFQNLGLVAKLVGDKNASDILISIRERLDKGGLSASELDLLHDSLRKMGAIEYFSPDTVALYNDTLKTHFSDREQKTQSTSLTELRQKISSLPQSSDLKVIVRQIKELANQKTLSDADTIEAFTALIAAKQYRDAAELLRKKLDTIAQFAKHLPDTKSRKEFVLALGTLNNNWPDLDAPLWYKTWLRDAIFLKTLFIKDKNARLAIFTHFDAAGFDGTKLIGGNAKPVFKAIFEKQLTGIKDGDEFLSKIDLLQSEFAVESHNLTEYIQRFLVGNPDILKTEEELARVIKSEHYWRKIGESTATIEKDWEKKIFDNYARLSKTYESYTYDPNHSEKLQRVLVERFMAIKPSASPLEKLKFWLELAKRGATGVSDKFFDEAYSKLTDPSDKKWVAEQALEKGLVWDTNIRTALYKFLNQDAIRATDFSKAPEGAELQTLRMAIDAFLRDDIPAGSQKIKLAKDLHTLASLMGAKAHMKELQRLIKMGLRDNPPKDLKEQFKKWNKAVSLVVAKRDLNSDRANSRLPELETKAEVNRAIVLRNELEKIQKVFPERGYAYIDLVNWLAATMQTSKVETENLKNQVTSVDAENSDMGYSVINSIIEEALLWDKAERWKLIRWFRGSGPTPPKLQALLRRIGPETVRRLYVTLPIFSRQALIGALIGAPRKGLLEGAGSTLYFEQILNEILPSEKESARIAKELLGAFLKSVKVSHVEKRTSVIAYLLANHAENSNTGEVLRNVLEAYGVVGVKLAQQLAGSDILPEDIRKELAKARDQSKEPFRHEIYERFEQVLGIKDLDQHIQIQELLGSASIKYTVKVKDKKTGKVHAVQVKREEAEASISRDFKQLDIIIQDLIGKDPKTYAFLRGMLAATKAAIWRELSLVRESERSKIAIEEYAKIQKSGDLKINIPKNTNLIDKLPGPASKSFYLRSAEFIDGKGFDKLPADKKPDAALAILHYQHELLFPEDKRDTHIDPDRHPGNIMGSVDKQTGAVQINEIDWGQLLKLTETDRIRIIKLLSYSQLFENIGVVPALFDKFIKEYEIPAGEVKGLKRALERYFPNTSKAPRSSLAAYYHMLSEMEEHGFERAIINYDFIKAIYQLEPYEKLWIGKEHESPKETLAMRVEANIKELSSGINPTLGEKIRYALIHPIAAITADRNIKLAANGQLQFFQMVQVMDLSASARKQLVTKAPKDLKTGSDFMGWLNTATADKTLVLNEKDTRQLEKWKTNPTLKAIDPGVLPAQEFYNLMATVTVSNHMSAGTEVKRDSLEQPHQEGFIKGTASMYGAELINAVFWGLYDRDKRFAMSWLREMGTLEKHLGFAAFAGSQTVYSEVSNRIIPMSLTKTRFLNQHGASMAVGMLASQMVHRLLKGQRFDDSLDATLSRGNLKDIAFSSAAFMAAEQAVKQTGKVLPKLGLTKGSLKASCRSWYQNLGRNALLFIMAEGIDRTARPTLTKLGVLDRSPLEEMDKLGKKYIALFNQRMEKVNSLLKEKKTFQAYAAFMIPQICLNTFVDFDPSKHSLVLARSALVPKYSQTTGSSASTIIAAYVTDLRELESRTTEKLAADTISEEIERIIQVTEALGDSLFPKGTVFEGWSAEYCKEYSQ